MGNDNILIVVVLAVVAYLIFTAEKAAEKAGAGIFGASLFGATAETPAGTITSTGAVGAVREIAKGSCLEYIFNPVMFATCIAGKTVTQSPQTPPPEPTKCPWDPNMLIGDIRCGTQEIDYPTTPTGCVSGEYYLDIPTGTFRRCP